jgi:hypothetical protein
MLSRLERAFERVVEGSIASAFRLRVQPAEIGRRLERAMLDGRVASVGATLGPNAFDVRLHPEDAASFADWDEALCHELETWLAELAYARGILTVGAIHVRVVEDQAVRRRSVIAVARFDAELRSSQSSRRGEASTPPMLRLEPTLEGVSRATLVSATLSVGRAPDNDLMIADAVVSRHHARLEAERNVWRVVDLESTNGTWLNGARISCSAFDVGDELAFGAVRFTVVAG